MTARRALPRAPRVAVMAGARPGIVPFRRRLFRVAVFGTEPDMIRDGSTIPIAKIFQDVAQKSVLMVPLGAVDDGEHSQNEKINRWGPPGGGPSAHGPTPRPAGRAHLRKTFPLIGETRCPPSVKQK